LDAGRLEQPEYHWATELTAPTASVIVPVHNRPRQIIACLESLAASDYDTFEIFVVDDASTDDTVAQVERFRQSHADFGIQLIQNRTNLGSAGTRDAGVGAARGDYVLFFDSDCIADRNWLREMVKPMAAGEAEAVTGKVLEVPARNFVELWNDGGSRVDRRMPTFIESSMGMRRDLAEQYPFDASLVYGGEGDDLARRMSLDGHRIIHVDLAVSYHDHCMTLAHCLRRGYLLGMGSARYWYKHDMVVGRDLLPLAAALLTLPLGLLGLWWLMVPGTLIALQLAALAYNEIVIKHKTLWQAVQVYPVSVLFYLARAAAVPVIWFRLAIGKEEAIRASKRQWCKRRTRRDSVDRRECSRQTLPDLRVAVCVITYLRPVGLRRLLDSLNQQTFSDDPPQIEIIVVDNDPLGSARSVCEGARATTKWPIRYEIEPRRGISFARNKTVECALENADWLAILDDDQTATPQWIDVLLRIQQACGADIVTGPVTPRFVEKVSPWIIKGRFFEFKRYETGTSVDVAYTNNVLASSKVFRELGEHFDEQFALVGGGDADFFRRAHWAGHSIVWADNAETQEWIPASRTRFAWLMRRQFRVGNSNAAVDLKHLPGWKTRFVLVGRAVFWSSVGVVGLLLSLVRGRHMLVRGLRFIAYAVGTLTAMFGSHYEEYRITHGS